MMARNCGTCSVCCQLFSIAALNKPEKVRCPNLFKQGFRCHIYDTRPKMCAEYNCSWKQGHGAKKDRPNATGVIVDKRRTQFGLVLVARSVRPGAVRTVKGKRTIERIIRSERTACFIVSDDNAEVVTEAIGSEAFMAAVRHERAKGEVRLVTQ